VMRRIVVYPSHCVVYSYDENDLVGVITGAIG
jgi:hypothetical protein